jgi:CTP synthase N-terminus
MTAGSSLVYCLISTLQIVPHLVNAIQDWIERVSKIPVDDTGEEPDVCIVEVCSRLSFDYFPVIIHRVSSWAVL